MPRRARASARPCSRSRLRPSRRGEGSRAAHCVRRRWSRRTACCPIRAVAEVALEDLRRIERRQSPSAVCALQDQCWCERVTHRIDVVKIEKEMACEDAGDRDGQDIRPLLELC